ncbi:MAG: hypothetical protein Q7U04_13470 [Bacteriovorax sp.]|nr:hypothetical protein [Bacteriovorax sp.]
MKKIHYIFYVLFILILPLSAYARKKSPSLSEKQLQSILDKAKQETARGSYDNALALLINYRKSTSRKPTHPVFSFYVIESIGRIYLRIKQDPDSAIIFFTDALNDRNLSDTEFDMIRAWLGRSKEWKELNIFPKNIKDPTMLFSLGKKYYDQGIKLQKYTMDLSASADFSMASNYLTPFTIQYDKDPNIGEALYMLGEIRRRSWHKNDYWVENFYLTEVIRRFPNTELASRAYQALYEDVHYGYTGSSGDHTPTSWIELLKEFEALSKVAKPASFETIKPE